MNRRPDNPDIDSEQLRRVALINSKIDRIAETLIGLSEKIDSRDELPAETQVDIAFIKKESAFIREYHDRIIKIEPKLEIIFKWIADHDLKCVKKEDRYQTWKEYVIKAMFASLIAASGGGVLGFLYWLYMKIRSLMP